MHPGKAFVLVIFATLLLLVPVAVAVGLFADSDFEVGIEFSDEESSDDGELRADQERMEQELLEMEQRFDEERRDLEQRYEEERREIVDRYADADLPEPPEPPEPPGG